MKNRRANLSSLCVLRLSAIGDVCHTTAIVQAIQAANPGVAITWIIGSVELKLVGDIPGIRFVVFDKRKGLKAYYAVYRELRALPPFDVLLQMQTSLRANLLGLLVAARRKIGFPRSKSKELHGLVVGERVQTDDSFHILDVLRAFAYAVDVPPFKPEWDIPIPPVARTEAGALMSSSTRFVLIAPSASNTERNWLPERYAAVARHCVAHDMGVIVTGSPAPHELNLATTICSLAGCHVVNGAGKTSLKTLLALCRRASLVIGPDSGTLHMATTQGTPVIGLYAHSNPQRTGPYCSMNYVVDVYTDYTVQNYGASKLNQWGFRLKGPELMSLITTQTVIDTVDRVLAASSR